MKRCGFLIIEQTAQNIQKRRKAALLLLLLLLLLGCKQALLRARDGAG